MSFSRSVARRIYDYLRRKWVLAAVLTSGPGLVFVLFDVVGETFKLKSSAGALTDLGSALFWASFVVAIVIAVVKAKVDAIDQIAKENAQFILDELVSGLDQIKHRKVRRFCEFIRSHSRETGVSPFHEITQPRMQIESNLEKIRDVLSAIFGIPNNDIGLSLIYRITAESDWEFLYTMNIENDISLEELLGNPQTSARQIIDGKSKAIFFARKESGRAVGQFVPGKLDEDRALTGSIICRDVSLADGCCAMRAILSITTYGQSVCDEDDLQAKKKIEQVILPSFELRLRNELALLYIKEVIAEKAPAI